VRAIGPGRVLPSPTPSSQRKPETTMERGHPARVVHDSPCNQSWMIRRTQQPCVLRMLQVGDANLCQAIVAYTNFVAVVHTSHCQSLRLNGNHLLIDGRHIQSSLFTGWRQTGFAKRRRSSKGPGNATCIRILSLAAISWTLRKVQSVQQLKACRLCFSQSSGWMNHLLPICTECKRVTFLQ